MACGIVLKAVVMTIIRVPVSAKIIVESETPRQQDKARH